MRTFLIALLLIVGVTARSDAQPAAATPPSQDTDDAQGLLPEPRAIGRAVNLADRWFGSDGSASRDGFYPDLEGMVTGAGWISAGPGYRQHFLDRHLFVDGSAAISWRAYKDTQAHVELTDWPGITRRLAFRSTGRT
jgi:hypothetical protein